MAKLLLLGAAIAAAVPGPGFDGPPVPLNLSRWRNKRVMVITAHPDDAEGFAGGVIAALRDFNTTVQYLILTQGNAGGMCYNASGGYQPASYACEREELGFLRRKEMISAAAFLGAKKPWRCGFDDGMLISVHESAVRERISGYVRKFAPAAVITHFMAPNWRAPPSCNGACPRPAKEVPGGWARQWDDLGFHPDHKDVGRHVFDALYGGGSAAANPLLFPELAEAGGLAGWQTPELYFFALTRDQPSLRKPRASATHIPPVSLPPRLHAPCPPHLARR